MRVISDRYVRPHRAARAFNRAGTVYTGVVAGVKLQKHVVQVVHAFESLHYVCDSAHRYVFVVAPRVLEGFYYAAADGIIPRGKLSLRAAFFIFEFRLDFFKVYALALEKHFKLFKGEHVFDKNALARLALFGYAGSHKQNHRVLVAFLYHFGMRDHGRVYGSKERQRFGIINFYQPVYRGTRRRNEVAVFSAIQKLLVLFRDGSRAQRRFLRVEKAESFERGSHHLEILYSEA